MTIVYDLLRDITLEMMGIDSKLAEREREEKKQIRENKKNEKFIFSKKTKAIIFIFGILYLVIGGFNMRYIKGHENVVLVILKFILLSAVDIVGLICLAIGKRKTEIAAFVLVIIFIFAMYTTTMLL